MEPNRRPRIVKRTPLYKRIINAPEDYTMKIGNDIRAMDWDMLQEGFSWPLAVSLNLLLTSVKMGYWLDDPLANVPTVLRNDRTHYSSKSMRPAFASLSKKNYKLLHRDLDDRPSASNIKMVEVQQEESHWRFKLPGKLIWYSPAQVLIMAGMNSDNIHLFLPLSIIVGLQVHFLVSVYQSYVKDKQVLFGEVSREYNVKFVHPRIFVRKFDKQVSTETESDPQLYEQGTSFQSTSDRKPRTFQHLSIPASRFSATSSNPLRLRAQPPSKASTSRSSSSDSSEDDDDEESNDDEDEGEEESVSESGDDDDGVDPDVDFDEDGEEPTVPHPTNALR
ncbi:hypothetical protein BGZ46_007526 [Entomortierella lignicola]|nr:hypothetical protein BGZ46_007526 [Entomortierella lignicola]